jgi:hypothetical protein
VSLHRDPLPGDLIRAKRKAPSWGYDPTSGPLNDAIGVVLEAVQPSVTYPAGKVLVSFPDREPVWVYWREIKFVDT